MVDPITGVGLASSIITLAEAGYKISKRTIEFSKLLGELPPDLQECSNLMEILIRAVTRLQVQLRAEDPTLDPVMADLGSLFDQCNQSAISLLMLIDRLHSSNSLHKAIQVTRKEGEITRIRNKLDQHVLALLFVLEEHQQAFNEDLRKTVQGLRGDFHQFHQELVEQMSRGFAQIETAVVDSTEGLLQDIRPIVAANGRAAHMSNLRLLAGQQDLSQNLHQVEQALVSILHNGEARLANRFQARLTEHQAATRTLFQSVYNRQNDDLRAQMQLLYQEVTKTLARCEAMQMEVDTTRPNNYLKVKASFEFDIRNSFIALHISQGMEWVSSTVLFPTMRPSSWLAVPVPVPRFDRRRRRCNALDTAVRSAPVNFMIKQSIDQYHLIKIDLSEEQYDQNISKAQNQIYSDYRRDVSSFFPFLPSSRLLGIGYVKYGSYSHTAHCFTAVERVSPFQKSEQHPAMNPTWGSIFTSHLPYAFADKDTFNRTRGQAPPMQEGHALMIEEGQDIGVTAVKLIYVIIITLEISVILFYTNQDYTDQLISGLSSVDFILFVSPFYAHSSLKKVLLFILLTWLVKNLLLAYFLGGEGMKMNLPYLIVSVITVPLHSFYPSFLLWLTNKYSITVEWKDVRGLFRQPQKLDQKSQ